MKRSGPGEGDLVRVRSESELRPGMTVWLRACQCGRDHAYLLVRRQEPDSARGCRTLDGSLHFGHPVWTTAPVPLHGGAWFCAMGAIAERRLYRLRDEATPQETTKHRHRERVE